MLVSQLYFDSSSNNSSSSDSHLPSSLAVFILFYFYRQFCQFLILPYRNHVSFEVLSVFISFKLLLKRKTSVNSVLIFRLRVAASLLSTPLRMFTPMY